MQTCYYTCESIVTHASGRCIADTHSAVTRIRDMLTSLAPNSGDDPPDALSASRWLKSHQNQVSHLPIEVEIELTTEDPLPSSRVRPRGTAVERRGLMDERLFRRLIDELAHRDDVRIVLGGFGDPLMHPQWPALVRHCREARIFALAMRTAAVNLDRSGVEQLFECEVDVVQVLLDATRPETYRSLHGEDYFERVKANLDEFLSLQKERNAPVPLLVPEMIKISETLDEIEAFYDHWLDVCGSAVLTGPSTYGGQWPDLAVMQMAPPTRFACSRLFDRTLVLADGRVTFCDQDFAGRHAVGSLADAPLSGLWTSREFQTVRKSHIGGSYDGMPLCPACFEWHRP